MLSLDTRLAGNVLQLRESMGKFQVGQSDTIDIEICQAPRRPLPVYLNRQLIQILADRGVPHSWFCDLQAKALQRIEMLTEGDPINISTFLRASGIGERTHLPWLFNALRKLSLDYLLDGFLHNVLNVAKLIELRSLKYKARIYVPEGYHLHGIMDETGILQGEIFVIFLEDGKPTAKVGKDFIVIRAPSLHPGDVQLANAISVPKNSPLWSLTNCICFSHRAPETCRAN